MSYFIALIIVGGMFAVIITRKKTKKNITIPESWHPILQEHVLFYQKLSPNDQQRFRKRMLDFLNEVYIDAVQFDLEEIDRVFVAASAVIPIFNFKDWNYTNITGVIIYPENFNDSLQFGPDADMKTIAGMIGTGKFENQMILSRKALHHGFKNKTDKRNTAIHEFVHLLDKNDGETDGIPESLLDQQYIVPWLNLMHQKMEAINNDQSDIRKYGGTKQAEFFTVAAEYFFERPKLLRRKHPELYKMMEMCFGKKEE